MTETSVSDQGNMSIMKGSDIAGDVKSTLEHINHQLKVNDIKVIRYEIVDAYGIPRCRMVPTRHFEDRFTNGLKFAASLYSNDPSGYRIPGDYMASNMGLSDVIAFPDPQTFTIVPWCKYTAQVLSDVYFHGKPMALSPRNIAKRQLDNLKNMGYSLLSGYEHEFVIYDKETREPIVKDKLAGGTARLLETEDFVMDVLDYFPQVGIDVDAVESEVSAGQMEITYKPSFGIKGADNAFLCKQGVKEIARKRGYLASFMTRPFTTDDTVTSHFNHSLWDVKGQAPLLASESEELSMIGQHWIAGIVSHSPGIAALMAPTVNCIRALGGCEPTLAVAPINATWGVTNRSVAINFKGAYVENRMSMGGSDPYIVLSATIAAGMDGLVRKLTLPPDVKSTAHDEANIPPQTLSLPSTMKQALSALLEDNVIMEALGDDYINWFVAAKKHEIKSLTTSPDSRKWEHNVFFENI